MDTKAIAQFNDFRKLCLKNAEDHIRAAELLLDKNLNHIAYHLNVLALEELGKIFMSWIQLSSKEKWGKQGVKISMDDHVKKLFYCIWGASIGQELITKEQLNQNQMMAKGLHERRLASLYGDLSDTVASSQKIGDEEIEALIRFAKARWELTNIEGETKEQADPSPHIIWWEEQLEIPERRNYIFGKESQEKLIKLDDVNEWIKWLMAFYEKEQKDLLELAQKEINRSVPAGSDQFTPKWEISFTVTTPSHSIRNSALSAFNTRALPFKLFMGKDKHTLIVKNTLGNNVTVNSLWEDGWLISQLFVASLNIASNGFFFWHAEKDIDMYYDTIVDLESKKKLQLKLATQLTLNWKEKQLHLTEQHLHLTVLVYDYLIQIRKAKEAKPIHEYLSGLSMLAKTDIHLRLEASSFALFYKAFKMAVYDHENLTDFTSWSDTGYVQIEGMLTDRVSYERIIKLAETLENNEGHLPVPISLTEVIAMKQYCGAYLLT